MKKHNIPRAEWVRRFGDHIRKRLQVVDLDGVIANAELESWPEHDDVDWELIEPEAAAEENLSYWDNDG